MKKNILIISVLLFFGCETILHENEDQYNTLDSDQEKIDLVNGIYSTFKQIYNDNYFFLLLNADDINNYEKYSFNGCSFSSNRIIKHEDIKDNLYQKLYIIVLSCNKLISQLTEPKDKELLGEILFLRAYANYMLTRFFGNPPLVTDTDVNYKLERPTILQFYEHIESDLLTALELLPPTYSASRIQYETPHQGTAKALLAEVYLSIAGYPLNKTEYYEKAAMIAREIIENSSYYNFGLLDDFADLWDKRNLHNCESIFSLYIDPYIDNFNKNILADASVPWDDQIYHADYIEGSYSKNKNYPNSKYAPELKFFKNFPHNYRKYTSLICGHYEAYTLEYFDSSSTLVEYVMLDPEFNPCAYAYECAYLKWVDRPAFDYEDKEYHLGYGSEIPVYLYRYTHTLLTYAEAKARSGEIDALAYDCVNWIRRRANNLPLNQESKFDLSNNLSPEIFIDSVIWERAWELCQEPNGRYFDLQRLELLNNMEDYRFAHETDNRFPDKFLTADKCFFTIPQNDQWLNPNFSDTLNTTN